MTDSGVASPASVRPRVRAIVLRSIGDTSGFADLSADASLWTAGMDSLTSVRIMAAVEEEFGVEFSEELLTRETFDSIASIAAAVETLVG